MTLKFSGGRVNVKHSTASCFKATTANISALAPLLNGGTRVGRWQST